jgi:hypothetical protein
MVTGTLASVRTDLEHGGRWTSLRLSGREWLWQRADPNRAAVRPGDAFVDAGGLEECVATVRGIPDHGAAWSRPWRRDGIEDIVECGDFVLRRQLRASANTARASYRLQAAPGYRFVWAAHALLDLGVGGQIVLPEGASVRLYPEAAPLLRTEWPSGAPYVAGVWPAPGGLELAQLGPDDGSAVGASVLDVDRVEVLDAGDRLRMRVEAGPEVPVSVAIWRNLGGFPAGAPYRSVGVEPMLGRVFDLETADDEDAVTVPAGGEVEWTLHLDGS